MKIVCARCNKSFDAWPSQHRKYCSRRCSVGQQRPIKPAFRWLFNKVRYEAKKAKRRFSLTFKQFLRFTRIKKCHYCKAEILWTPHALPNKRCYYLDRKNNDRGYEQSNCVVCCSRCNRAKSKYFTYTEWMRIGKVIRSFRSTYGN